ncbi:MAG: tetratricopeptide repeat protein [Ignavibacteria bacterium]
MIKKYTLLALVFSLIIICTGSPKAQNQQNLKELLQQGDKLAEKQFDNNGALDKYMAADKINPGNWEIYWRISRSYVDIADELPASSDIQKAERQAEYQAAFDYADKAVRLAPDKSVTYLRRAIANGKIALFKGIFSVIGIVNRVKEDAETALKLGNGDSHVQAVSHYVLGRTHLKVCEKPYLVRLPLGLGWGDLDKAESELKTAVEIKPNFRMFYLELAKLYIENDEYQKAKENLNKLERSPKANQDDDKFLAEGRTLIEKIKDK